VKLTDNEKRDIIKLLEADKPLPDKYRFLLFDDKREVALVWNGKSNEVCNILLPFQTIEQVDEPRAEKLADTAIQPGLFDLDPRGRQLKGWTNKLIWGDNKLILSSLKNGPLRETIEQQGGLKLIYIDPPYNTGGDFIYDDDFSDSIERYLKKSGQTDAGGQRLVANTEANGRFHSDWLSMMYPRLKLARNLLKDDGVIFISIDDHEIDNLRKLCDEVFGAQNFVAQIIWQKVYSPKNSASWFSEDHDYIVCYARNKSHWAPQPLARTEAMDARYKNPDDDPRGPWKSVDMSARNRYDAGIYPVTTPSGRVIPGPPTGRYWGISERLFLELDADNRIWWGAQGENAPAVKRFLSEVSGGRTPQTLWFYEEVGHTQDAKKTLLKYVPFEYTENVLNSVKPVELIQRILQLAGRPNDEDLILDFFSGSGTTAHAVLKQNAEDGGNRRFIAIQIDEPLARPEASFNSILGMSLTRFRNVSQEIRMTLGGEKQDLGYRLTRVDSSNLADVQLTAEESSQDLLSSLAPSVKTDRSDEDLLFQVLLDWGLDLAAPISIEQVEDLRVLSVAEDALIACFAGDVTDTVVREIAQRHPLRAVFLDAGFATDSARINAEQIFREVSPETEVRTI